MLGHVYFDLLADEDDGLLSISSQLSFASELRGNLIWIWPVPDSQTLHVELLVTFFENIYKVFSLSRSILSSFDKPILCRCQLLWKISPKEL